MKRLAREHPGELMLTVPVPFGSLKAGNDDERPLPSNDLHQIPERLFPSPLLDRLREPLRIAVVREPREVERIEPVVAPRRGELFRPNPAEAVEQLGSDSVRPGLAAGETHQGDPRSLSPAQKRQHSAMLVVGVRRHMEEARPGLELLEFFASRDGLAEALRREQEPEGPQPNHPRPTR